MKSKIVAAAVLVSAIFPLSPLTVEAQQPGATTAPAAEAMTDGEIRKVDRDAKKITIRHGAIENLGMPPMTMVFQVKDPAMLDQIKEGDRIRFRAEKVGGAFTATRIEPAK